MKDPIERLAAIDVMCELMHHWFGGDPKDEIREIKRELEKLPSAQPEVIYCKDCKHRPKATRADEKVFYGFSVKFPDEKCPCYCEDGWYGWYPEDDFYCGYAERREDERSNRQATGD